MEDKFLELSEKVISLEKLYNQTILYLNENITNFTTVFIGILSLSGVGLWFLAQNMVKMGIDKGTMDLQKKYDDKIAHMEAFFKNEKNEIENLFMDQIENIKVIKEYGLWTPLMFCSNNFEEPEYEISEGRYYRIDNIVILQANIKLIRKNNISGAISIGGLPFASKNENVFGNVSRTDFANFNNEVYLLIEGPNKIGIYEKLSNRRIKAEDIKDNFEINGINIIYEI